MDEPKQVLIYENGETRLIDESLIYVPHFDTPPQEAQ